VSIFDGFVTETRRLVDICTSGTKAKTMKRETGNVAVATAYIRDRRRGSHVGCSGYRGPFRMRTVLILALVLAGCGGKTIHPPPVVEPVPINSVEPDLQKAVEIMRAAGIDVPYIPEWYDVIEMPQDAVNNGKPCFLDTGFVDPREVAAARHYSSVTSVGDVVFLKAFSDRHCPKPLVYILLGASGML